MKDAQILDWSKAREAIEASPIDSSIYIGCDSLRYRDGNGKGKARYSIVVIVHKSSRSGASIFHNTFVLDDFGHLKQRLDAEVGFVVSTASELLDSIGKRRFELHLDINPDPKHKSNIAMKEAVGWVMGMFGKPPILKPDSFAATHAADHVVRQ